jgi:hypothetical protein
VLAVVRAHPSEWTVAVDVLARHAHPDTAARLAALLTSDEVRFDPQAILRARPPRPPRSRAPPRASGRRAPRSRAVRRAPRLLRRSRAALAGARAGARRSPARAAPPSRPAARTCSSPPTAWAAPSTRITSGAPRSSASTPPTTAAASSATGDLDLAGLTALLDEGFIHPQAQQNDAPPTTAFFQLMTAWPELRASGYAVSPRRPDYRTMIDGLSVDFTALPPPRAAALRAELEALAASATNTELDDDSAHLWWT